MGLKETLAKGAPTDRRRKCGLAIWLETLPPDEQQAAQEILTSPEWTTTAAHAAFVREGYGQTANVVSRHNLMQCACAR